jgi:CRISPR system Cascade subunit CasD
MKMSTLLLRLSGPLQAWGYESKFETRRTGREPTKSGVIGLLAAALGRKRDDSLDDLTRLRFGVRVDKEGNLLQDYQIAQTKDGKSTYVTYRYYLSDATFLVGLESEEEEFLAVLQQALLHPAYPLFLGRRSCAPSLPLVVGIRSLDLLDALKNEPWQLTPWMQKKEKKQRVLLRLITDASGEDGIVAVQKDLPVTFHPGNRRYTYRSLKEHAPVVIEEEMPEETDHDAMSEL